MSEGKEYKPRLCSIAKGPSGFGFHLHGQKGVVGQKIRKVEEGSPADEAGLLAGDRIIAVNGKNVQNESHAEVVACIKERSGQTELLVVDEETFKHFTEKNMEITADSVSTDNSADSHPVEDALPNPRLCHLVKTTGGFGFNLHSEKANPGRFISSVESGSPADIAGLRKGDRIVEVNDVNIESGKHSDLVAAIKQSGDEVDLLVVDEATDKHFKSLNITPTRNHIDNVPTSAPEEAAPTPVEEAAHQEPDAPVSSPTPEEPSPPAPEPAAEPAAEIEVVNEEQPPSPTPDQQPTPVAAQNGGADFSSMDLTALKEKAMSGRKKRGSDSSWRNKHALFNKM